MTPLELTEVMDRLTGEFEVTMSDDEHTLWRDSIATFDRAQCIRAIENCLDRYDALPSITTFRMECIKVGQKANPKSSCTCRDGWEEVTDDNYVVACRQCTAGDMRAACTEAYRAERSEWRRKHRSPEFLREKVATPESAHSWADQARDWLVNGMPEPEVALVDGPRDDEDEWF